MWRIALLALSGLLATMQPAIGHRLKLFATVEGGTVSGYGFFIGGGRPQAAAIIIRDAEGKQLYQGKTDDHGAFSWRPPKPADVTVVIDAGDGHVAQTAIAAGRFGANAPVMTSDGAPPILPSPDNPAGQIGQLTAAQLSSLIDQSVDRAVARQTRPLLEAYYAADGRVRFNDVIGGIGMIIGLAGFAVWAKSRRR